MKFQIRHALILTAVSALVVTSCSKKSNTLGKHIPSTAGIVIHINGKSANEKLPWSEVKNNSIFTKAYGDTAMSSYMRSLMDNPENTGIDMENDLVIFMQKDSSGSYVALEGALKDPAKFATFNSNVQKVSSTKEVNGVKYASSDRMTAGWNKDMFVMISDIPDRKLNMPKNYAVDSMGMPVIDSSMTMADTMDMKSTTPLPKRNLNADAEAIFNLKEDQSLAKEERFTDLLNTKGDLHLWINSESFYAGMSDKLPMNMTNLSKMYENSRTAATVNFEDGKIVMDARSYASKQMTDLWKDYQGKDINMDLLRRLPGNELAGFVTLNFKPEGIRELLKMLALDGFANMGAGSLGFNLDDFISANKGEILFAVSNLSIDSANKPAANFIFVSGIGNQAAFGKLITAGKTFGVQAMGPTAASKIFYQTGGDLFAIGNNQAAVNSFISSNQNSSLAAFDKFSGNPAAAYINFQYIFNKLAPAAEKDSSSLAVFKASQNMWDNLTASGGDYEKGSISQHAEINLVDKKTNSLRQLNAYSSQLGTEMQKKEALKK